MKLLAVDTALGACSAAVLENDRVLAAEWCEMVRGHAEELAPMVERLMRESGIAFAALDRLAVTTGPGTFTGQRVGLAFMRAMRVALKKPLAGITTLDAMAEAALAADASAHWALAVSDAKRGELYLGARARGDEALVAPELVAMADVGVRLAPLLVRHGAPVLAGTAAPLLLPLLEGARDSAIRQPDARFVAALARRLPDIALEDVPRPLYLRAPDAKLPAGA